MYLESQYRSASAAPTITVCSKHQSMMSQQGVPGWFF